MKRDNTIKWMIAFAAISTMLSGCSKSDTNSNSDTNRDTEIIEEASSSKYYNSIVDVDDMFSKRDLSGEYDEKECIKITLANKATTTSDDKSVSIDGDVITIKKEGDYIISGSLTDGMIIVDVDEKEKVQLVLDGVSIESKTSAAIYVKQADKVFVTLAEGSTNTLKNSGTYEAIDDNNIDAVVFAKDDLTFNGTGSLTIEAPDSHGIVCKDDLVFANGVYNITATEHAIDGKDSVRIADGTFVITTDADAIHSKDSDDCVGYVYVKDGSFTINAGDDGITAYEALQIDGGTIQIQKSYEGLEGKQVVINGGEINIVASDDGINAAYKDSTSNNFNSMAAQEDALIEINGGTIIVDAKGDGIDSNGTITQNAGSMRVSGSTDAANSPIDFGVEFIVNGGDLIAVGNSGMAEGFSEKSTQGCYMNTVTTQSNGGLVSLVDGEGKELLAWTAPKSYNLVMISCPELKENAKYSLKSVDETIDVAMDTLVNNAYEGFGGFGGFGGPGGQGGFGGQDGQGGNMTPPNGDFEMPEGTTPPDGDFEMPEGVTPPDGDFEMPDGMTPPDGDFEKPDGKTPPNGGEKPNGQERPGNNSETTETKL